VGVVPRVLLIHGSAADASTWAIQLASAQLRERFALIAYDRALAETVEDGAAEAVAQLGDDAAPALVIGSSFGAVIALEALRTQPARFCRAVLIEPPMAASDELLAAPASFLPEFDRRVAEHGGPAGAELFMRTVLGDAAFERMPKPYRERSLAKWQAIRADSVALIAYRPRYGELARVTTPVLLLGGDRSAAYFAPTLDALERALPYARRETIANAGHMLHAEANRRFAELVIAFDRSLRSP
jgi:pimeloyl-ACP methyl ester carboxylesterase